MDSFKDTRRQIIIALVAIAVVISIGVIGFMVIEGLELLDAIWLTVITLATIGYGDVYARSVPGRVFTIFLIFAGISVFAFGLQATASFFFSPIISDLRRIRRAQRRIDQLTNHYIICGDVGELVDQAINSLLNNAERRRASNLERVYRPLDHLLDRLFGDDALGHYARPRAVVRRIYWAISRPFLRGQTLLDVIVVIASDPTHADELRDKDMLVIEGKPTDDITLRKAGVERAHALMVMLGSDSEALLTVLTARSYNAKLYITAANVEEELTDKMMRVGANAVITPFDVAGQFLNNATLRPAVSDFFNSIMFSQIVGYETTQLYLYPGSTWIGSRIGKLNLRERFSAGIIGLRHVDNSYMYAPNDDYPLHADEVLIAVAPAHFIEALNDASLEGVPPHRAVVEWSHPHTRNVFEYTPKHTYSILEADGVIQKMSQHYVICGTDRVARNAINKLNPERPFVIISDDNQFTSEQIKRGFRVIHGNPTHEEVLRRAGVDRALAIMVSIDDKADSVLTVLTCRSLSDRLLITATASSDDMVRKLHRAGADRVASPFHIAAQFVLLATTRPAVSDYFQYVLFNYHAELETTELYMQTDSPWIGESIESLRLERLFRAGVIGVRLADGTYRYAPPGDHVLQPHEVMIVVTPMVFSDELRDAAHGGITKRPTTLRKLSVSSGNSPL